MDILSIYFKDELQDNRALFAYTLMQCQAIDSGESQSFDEDGDVFRIYADLNGVELCGHKERTHFSLKEFIQAVKDGLASKLKDQCEKIQNLYKSQKENGEFDLEAFAGALKQFGDDASLLTDLDAIMLFEVFVKQLLNERFEDAKSNARLIDKIADVNQNGYSKNFILYLAQEFLESKQLQEANLYVRKASANHLAKRSDDDPNFKRFSQHLFKIYLEILKADKQAADFESFQAEFKENASSIARLHLGLYKNCGLYNEYMKATGMSSLADNLHLMVRGLTGDSAPNPQHAPVQKMMSLDELQSLLKTRITKNASAAADYNLIQKLSNQIESSYARLKNEKSSQYPELIELIRDDISFVLEIANSLKLADGTLLEIDADPDASENTPESYKFSDIAIDIDQIPELLPWLKTRYNPDAGSPNAEPLILWKHHKYGKMLVTHTPIARKMSGVVINYVDYFHSNKATALPRVIEDFQKAFAGEKEFLDQCFSELKAFYQAAQRPEQADLFAVPHVVLVPDAIESEPESMIVKIYIPMELMPDFESLNMDLPMQIVSENLQWSGIEGEDNETLAQEPGQKFHTMSIETQVPEQMFQLCKMLLKKYPNRNKLFLACGELVSRVR